MKYSFKISALVCFLLTVCIGHELYSQTVKPTKFYARPYKDSIALRWHPFDIQLWERNIKKGYDIYRKSADGEVTKINDSTIRALDPTQFPFRYLSWPPGIDTTTIDPETHVMEDDERWFKYTPDTMAMQAMILQFPEEVGFNDALPVYKEGDFLDFGTDRLQIRWLFHSILCLSSKEAAIVSGLYFMDTKVNPNVKYTYYLTTAGESWENPLATTTLSPNDPYPIHAPDGFSDFTNKRRSVVMWKKADTAKVYIPVYDIFRSDKENGAYTKLNAKEILAIYTGDSQRDSTIVSYSDSTLQKEKVYYYKVRGMDVFGDYTPLSKAWKVTEKTLIQAAPFIEESDKEGNPPVCRIKWRVEPKEEDNISFFRVYKSNKPDTLFVPHSGQLKPTERTYVDEKPAKNNYYKLLTVGKAGDSLWTSPAYVLVPDSIPPSAPVMLEAICDSAGIVTITWKHNNETDLHSFKIYRANYENEEFSRVGTIERVDTVYTDTISLNALDDAVYYKLLAYDDSYNPSIFSNVIRAKRYDIIAPNFPVFVKAESGESGITLTWGNSSSEDVIKTTLYRKLKDEMSWHEYKTFVKDSVPYFTYADTSLYRGQWYEYTLQAFDDDGLKSGFSPTVQVKAYDNGFRKEITQIKVKSNTRKRIVKLSWEYGQTGVERFQIFRSVNEGSMLIYKSVKANEFEFYDKEIGSGNTYTYRIKAVYKDGGESPFSKEIIVDFKR